MKKTVRSIKLIISLSFLFYSASAQHNGITISPFNASYYANTNLFFQGYMGVGYERNVGNYVSLKLEINKGFQIVYNISDGAVFEDFGANYQKDVQIYQPGSSYYHNVYYHWTVPVFEVNYQSKFFFSGNDKSGIYLASGFGVKSIKYQLHLGDVYNNYNTEYAPPDLLAEDGYTATVTTFPLSLRFGFRADLKGFYPDFNMGFGYAFGHNKSFYNETINSTYALKVPSINAITISGSICFGIGW